MNLGNIDILESENLPFFKYNSQIQSDHQMQNLISLKYLKEFPHYLLYYFGGL